MRKRGKLIIKDFVRYSEGAEMYSMGKTKFQEFS